MALLERGHVQGGQIVLARPLTLPEGTEVVVHIEPIASGDGQGVEMRFASLPFFGMWAGREDIEDSAAWVRKERKQWHQRAPRPE
jgi:hypothetical protein